MSKHYSLIPAKFGLDRAVMGPGVYAVFAPELKGFLKEEVLPLLEQAYAAGVEAGKKEAVPTSPDHGAPLSEGTHGAASANTN